MYVLNSLQSGLIDHGNAHKMQITDAGQDPVSKCFNIM